MSDKTPQRSRSKANSETWSDAAITLRRSKARESDARTRLLKLQLQEKQGDLFSMSEVQGFFGPLISALRIQLLELGPNLAPRVNPADPDLASSIISESIRGILQSASEQVERFTPAAARKRTAK